MTERDDEEVTVDPISRAGQTSPPRRRKKAYVIRRVRRVTPSSPTPDPERPPEISVAEPREQPVSRPVTLSPEERYRAIAEAAYYIAERRGFQGGDPAQDWREAEAEIDAWLLGKDRTD
jgi:hypothetical protein